MFANIQHLTTKKRDLIQADNGYMACDIILLSECHMNLSRINQFKIDGYKLIKATGNKKEKSSNGQLCYWRESELQNGVIKFMAHNADQETDNYDEEYNKNLNKKINPFHKEMVEISMYEYTQIKNQKKILLIQVYVHPDNSDSKKLDYFISSFNKFATKHLNNVNDQTSIMIFGDFNIDFNNTDIMIKWQNNVGNNFNLKPLLNDICTRPKPLDIINKCRQLDWVFSNIHKGVKTMPYCSWYSDHLPLYTKIKYHK